MALFAIGYPSWFVSDGSPLTTSGDDRNGLSVQGAGAGSGGGDTGFAGDSGVGVGRH